MKGMTILEMRARKIEVEAAINALLGDFQNETGAEVQGIYIDKIIEVGVPMPTIFSKVDVSL